MENMENVENVEKVEAAPEVEVQPVAPEVEAQPVAPVKSSKNMSIAALVCGILGLVGGWIPVVSYFTLVLSILGIVFGAKAKKAAVANGEPTGMATTGLVLGIIAVALTVIGLVCGAALGAMLGLAAMSA